jgi:dihydrofolate reductase
VLTHRPLPPAAKGIEVWSGELRPHVERLREQLEPGGKDIWLLGGGEALRAFAQEDLIDRWEISRMPILLGDGVPLFPRHDGGESPLQLVHHRALPNGIVEEHYEPVRGGAAPPPRAGKRRR